MGVASAVRPMALKRGPADFNINHYTVAPRMSESVVPQNCLVSIHFRVRRDTITGRERVKVRVFKSLPSLSNRVTGRGI